MLSHSIVVKDVKSSYSGWYQPEQSPSIANQEELSRYINTLNFLPGDFVTWGQTPVNNPAQVSCITSIEKDFAYLIFAHHTKAPKILELVSLGSDSYKGSVFKRMDAVDSYRKLTEQEFKTIIFPNRANILHRCKKHFGPEIIASLEAA